jgi:hypothetical protein
MTNKPIIVFQNSEFDNLLEIFLKARKNMVTNNFNKINKWVTEYNSKWYRITKITAPTENDFDKINDWFLKLRRKHDSDFIPLFYIVNKNSKLIDLIDNFQEILQNYPSKTTNYEILAKDFSIILSWKD